MSFQTNALAKRLEGRLMVYEGSLCMVVDVDRDTGMTRMSRGTSVGPEVFSITTTQLRDSFAAGADLLLDGLNNPKTFVRVKEMDSQWFFVSREGEKGPYATELDARKGLHAYIVSSQENKGSADGPDAKRPGPKRRSYDDVKADGVKSSQLA